MVQPSTPELATPQKSATFRYEDLEPAIASAARKAAQRIRSRLGTVTLAAIEIGRDLLSMKQRLPHGQFGTWVEAEVGWNERTAQRYMRAAEVFGAKPDIVSVLPLTVVHQLAAPSMPLAVREKILARAVAGERVEPSAVSALVREAKGAGEERPPPHRPEQPKVDEGTPGVPGGERSQDQPQPAFVAEESRKHSSGRSVGATEEAARLIIERVGSDLDHLAKLLKRADPRDLVETILSVASDRHEADCAHAAGQLGTEGRHQPEVPSAGKAKSIAATEAETAAPAPEVVNAQSARPAPASAGRVASSTGVGGGSIEAADSSDLDVPECLRRTPSTPLCMQPGLRGVRAA